MSLLSLLLSLKSDLVDIIFEALSFEFQFVILGLKQTLRSALFFDFLGMLNQQVILVHLGQVALFADFDQLCVEV